MRCSSLPLLWLCPGAGRADDGVLIDSHYDAADDGTDVHRLLAGWPNGDAPAEVVAELSEDARIMYFTGAKMWREEISSWMSGSVAEVELESADGLTGHVDRMTIRADKKTVVILDWKTGRKDGDHKHQGFGYAYLAMRDLFRENVEMATVHFAWVRTKELESYTVSRERATAWNEERWSRIGGWDGKFTVGDHCSHCPRGSSCPARRQLVRSEVETLTTVGLPDVTAMTGVQLVEFHRRLKVLEAVLTSAQKNVRMEVAARGDVLSDDGHVLHLVEENGPRVVDTMKAWPVLNRALEAEELASCLTVRLGEVENLVAEKAGRGNGAKAKRALAAELEALGAVEQSKQWKLKMERTK